MHRTPGIGCWDSIVCVLVKAIAERGAHGTWRGTSEAEMRCRQCELENDASSRCCSGCGSELGVCCPRCQQVCPENATFCNWCGSMLGPVVGPLVDGAERKQATVLFVDIVASTE